MSKERVTQPIIDRNNLMLLRNINKVRDLFLYALYNEEDVKLGIRISPIDGFLKKSEEEMMFHHELSSFVLKIIRALESREMQLVALGKMILREERELSRVNMTPNQISEKMEEIKQQMNAILPTEARVCALYFDAMKEISQMQVKHVDEWEKFNSKMSTVIIDITRSLKIELSDDERAMITSVKPPAEVRLTLLAAGIDPAHVEKHEVISQLNQEVLVFGAILKNQTRVAPQHNHDPRLKEFLKQYFDRSSYDSSHLSVGFLCNKFLDQLKHDPIQAQEKFEKIADKIGVPLNEIKDMMEEAKKDHQQQVKGVRNLMNKKNEDGQSIVGVLQKKFQEVKEIDKKQTGDINNVINKYQSQIDQLNGQSKVSPTNGVLAGKSYAKDSTASQIQSSAPAAPSPPPSFRK